MKKQYEDLLQYVERPGRYIGGEINSIVKDWNSVDLKVALAFPDIYDIGMSHLGIKILYHILNSRSNILCERVFAPWSDMEALLRRDNLPLFSLESNRSVSEFDIVGFSFAHELNYTNVLNILNMSGIPLRSEERDASHPLIIAGGPCAFNPEPMADFIDIFLIGDGEEAVPEIVECCISMKRSGRTMNKADILKELASIEGVYIPGLYEPSYAGGRFHKITPREKYAPAVIKKRLLKNLEASVYPSKQIVPYIPVVHDRVSLEIMRGCPHRCRFCQATMIYSPVRLRSEKALFEIGKAAQAMTGHDEISLLSLSTGDYPGVVNLLHLMADEFKPQGVSISLPSLRVEDSIESLPSIIRKIKKTGLTFAPEVGSSRLRKFINKNIDSDTLLCAAKKAYELGWRKIKLYFMIGFPGETEEDVDSIINLAYDILSTKDKSRRGTAEITISVSSFIPKAHTIFQWEAMAAKEVLKSKISRLRSKLHSGKIKLNVHNVDMSILEAIFSRGDRRTGLLVETAYKKGARFDNWKDIFKPEIWQASVAECGIDIMPYLGSLKYTDPLPWSHINAGQDNDLLIRENILAHEEAGITSCGHL
ncbi:MAG: TIGR03960 family B12-binding radical SAM protein [Candidatus Omnitrophota bacterium]|nr:TIGR03960 family B12-binding radical SAM protein [Candidatus Omnitrophota bacterium]